MRIDGKKAVIAWSMAIGSRLGVQPTAIFGRDRRRKVVEARFAVAVAMADQLGYGPTEIGRLLNRDHGAVSHAVTTVSSWLETDREFAHRWKSLVVPAVVEGWRSMV